MGVFTLKASHIIAWGQRNGRAVECHPRSACQRMFYAEGVAQPTLWNTFSVRFSWSPCLGWRNSLPRIAYPRLCCLTPSAYMA